MRIVQGDQVAPEPAVRHRGGGLKARILLEGAAGTLGNYQLSLGQTGEDFVSPRHRHNFEQYRTVLEGRYDFGRDGVMGEAAVGYFPEGVYYGPQSSGQATLAAVLQFGGASGGGYLSAGEVNAGMEALQQFGEFQKGVFRRNEGVPGRKNQDAFEAIWEHVNGRPLAYPASRYPAPVMMDPAEAEWVPVADAPGAAEKLLGEFAEHRTAARLLRLDPGARLVVHGRAVHLTLSGRGSIDNEPLRRLTAFEVEQGETAALAAEEPVTVIRYDLPVFAPDRAMQAAE